MSPKSDRIAKVADNPWPELCLRHIDEAIMVAGKSGEIVLMNPAAEQITGVSLKSALGRPLGEVFKLSGSQKMPSLAVFTKNPNTRLFRHSQIITKSGRKILVDGSISPIFAGKDIRGCVLACRDVGEAAAEERLSLDRQKIEAIGILAGSVSRDFSNWLSTISSHAAAIADNLIPKTSAHEEALRILEVVAHATNRTKRLLSVSRAAIFKVEQICLEEAVNDAVSLVEGAFVKHKIVFDTGRLEPQHFIMADHGQFLDAIMTIFLNMAEAMPQGGTITVRISEMKKANGRHVVLAIRDTGKVIDKEVLDQVFQTFFTAPKEHSTANPSGLSLVNQSMGKWGGFMNIRSRPGRGNVLRLILPCDKAGPAKEKIREAAGGETILIVDDDTELLSSMKTGMEDAGYRTITASSAEEALAIYRSNSSTIQLSVIDLVMPEKDGKHLLTQILKIDPSASIIMSSGFSRDYVRSYLERGAWSFIQKPYDRSQLRTIVRRVLDQKIERQRAKP